MLKWLFFDMGSTLVDETLCTEKRARLVAEASGLPYDEVWRRTEELARRGDAHAVSTLAASLELKLPPWDMSLERAYPDAAKTLKRLSERFKIGVIANQPPGSNERLQAYGLLQYLDLVVASAEEGLMKPDPRIFELALQRAGGAPEEAVMIGDRPDNDLVPARAVGMRTCWVRQGLGGMSELPVEADWVVSSLSELVGIF